MQVYVLIKLKTDGEVEVYDSYQKVNEALTKSFPDIKKWSVMENTASPKDYYLTPSDDCVVYARIIIREVQ